MPALCTACLKAFKFMVTLRSCVPNCMEYSWGDRRSSCLGEARPAWDELLAVSRAGNSTGMTKHKQWVLGQNFRAQNPRKRKGAWHASKLAKADVVYGIAMAILGF